MSHLIKFLLCINIRVHSLSWMTVLHFFMGSIFAEGQWRENKNYQLKAIKNVSSKGAAISIFYLQRWAFFILWINVNE